MEFLTRSFSKSCSLSMYLKSKPVLSGLPNYWAAKIRRFSLNIMFTKSLWSEVQFITYILMMAICLGNFWDIGIWLYSKDFHTPKGAHSALLWWYPPPLSPIKRETFWFKLLPRVEAPWIHVFDTILGDVGLIKVAKQFSFGYPKCHFWAHKDGQSVHLRVEKNGTLGVQMKILLPLL